MRYVSETVAYEAYTGQGKGAHGNTIDAWADATEVGIYAFSPGLSAETFPDGTARTETAPTLFVPTDTVLGHRGRVTVTGEPDKFEVDGETRPFRNPYDESMDGNVVTLKKVRG